MLAGGGVQGGRFNAPRVESSPRSRRSGPSAKCHPAVAAGRRRTCRTPSCGHRSSRARRSEEHTSELQSQSNLVCRLLLEKKKKEKKTTRAAAPCSGRGLQM